jgi:hypothetical protein
MLTQAAQATDHKVIPGGAKVSVGKIGGGDRSRDCMLYWLAVYPNRAQLLASRGGRFGQTKQYQGGSPAKRYRL